MKRTMLPIPVLVLLVLPWPAAADNLPDGPYVSTSAAAVEEVDPDFAVIDLQFRAVEARAEAARERTDAAQRRLVALLSEFEHAIRNQRLETIQFGGEFEFDRQQQKQVQVGYFGSFTFRLEIDDFDALPKLHYALAGLEWNSLGNPRFEVADPEAAERAVRERALNKAASRAAELARVQGTALGAIWGIIYEPMHDLAGRSPGIVGDQRTAAPVIRASAGTEFALPMEPRPVRFEARVGVVFRLAGAPE